MLLGGSSGVITKNIERNNIGNNENIISGNIKAKHVKGKKENSVKVYLFEFRNRFFFIGCARYRF
jgi:hypothetical protein